MAYITMAGGSVGGAKERQAMFEQTRRGARERRSDGLELEGGTRIGAIFWCVGGRVKQQRMAISFVLDGRIQNM